MRKDTTRLAILTQSNSLEGFAVEYDNEKTQHIYDLNRKKDQDVRHERRANVVFQSLLLEREYLRLNIFNRSNFNFPTLVRQLTQETLKAAREWNDKRIAADIADYFNNQYNGLGKTLHYTLNPGGAYATVFFPLDSLPAITQDPIFRDYENVPVFGLSQND